MSDTNTSSTLLHIRPAMPDSDDASTNRGPMLMEPAISGLHSLKGHDKNVNLGLALHQGSISFFVRGSAAASGLIESQLYAQYPDIDIETLNGDILEATDKEIVVSADLKLMHSEVLPIKRHPQFEDLLMRQNVDSMASITSSLVSYPEPNMRGVIQVVVRPVSKHFRKRVMKFVPLLIKGFPKRFEGYAKFFTKVHLARGWRWWAYLPLNILMGGFRAWFSFTPNLSELTMLSDAGADNDQDEREEYAKTGRRTHEGENTISAIADKVNRLLFEGNVRISVIARKGSVDKAKAKLKEIAATFGQFTLTNFNGFEMGPITVTEKLPIGFSLSPYILSVEEVATLYHFPNALVKTPNIDWVKSKKLEPPNNLPIPEHEEELTLLGEAVFRGHRREFGIRPDDRRRHMYIIGKTGMGKSTLLENMIASDIQAGKGVAVIDPHGDLIENMLKCIPASRTNDVILFDPSDREWPLSFNMLSCKSPDQYSLVASGMMSVFTKLWPDVWSGRMEHILRNALLALLESQGNSMMGILRLFSDDAYRAKIVMHLKDPLVKSFWEDEYANWSEKYRTEAIAAIQNKIGQLLSVPMIRNIVGQTNSKLTIRDAMDTGKIILVNLSKGNLGEDNSAFLGSMLVTKFQLDAMSRADIPERDRKDFYLYVDEFQNFATESFATILSEARKYRLNLTIANQYIGQLLLEGNNTALKDAVFGNVGSMVCFQVGSDDAEELALQFEEVVSAKDILSLPKYHAYMRLMVNGMASRPFSVHTLPPPKAEDTDRVSVIRRASRERYCEKRSIVEDNIGKWLAGAKENRKTQVSAEKSKEKEAEEKEKAKKKGMKLDEYRAWRDREMWTNDFNMIRKKKLLEGPLTPEEEKTMADLEQKLEKSGGVPPVSKAINELLEKRAKKAA